ncbi:hypothetical protein [Nonomuraea polychroma]|uniref:hypothetical protein n=1 Tax=Nonomuraea polychroma TaxID=46176 RepID=UPI0013E40A3D|nr:hypothetical protein [Nonomuraea polychroma]
MTDPHVTINLTFRTPAAAPVVLEHIVAAINKHGMPYQLANAGCDSFDLDEMEET